MTEKGEKEPLTNGQTQEKVSKKFILLVAILSVLCDWLLLSVIVPILPVYLKVNEVEHRSRSEDNPLNNSKLIPVFFGINKTASGSQSEENLLDNNTFTPASASSFTQFKIGALFASKAIVQIIVNPFVGYLAERVGYSLPLYAGFCVIIVSTLVYAFADVYGLLFAARAVQGIGSACIYISSLAMLSAAYPDDDERGAVLGMAMGIAALGVVVGPPFGGLFYSLGGKELPFLILAGLICITFGLALIAKKPNMPMTIVKPTLLNLLSDPYILIAAGTMFFSTTAFALLEPTLPIWLVETMGLKKWKIGLIFLPLGLMYIVTTPVLGIIANKMGRWLAALMGTVLVAVSLFLVSVAETPVVLAVILCLMGFAMGTVDAGLSPALAHLVDIRHAPIYGSVFAIQDFAFSVGFAIGPLFAGWILTAGSFPWLLRGLAIVNLLFSPLLVFLRNPPAKNQSVENEEGLLEEGLDSN